MAYGYGFGGQRSKVAPRGAAYATATSAAVGATVASMPDPKPRAGVTPKRYALLLGHQFSRDGHVEETPKHRRPAQRVGAADMM